MISFIFFGYCQIAFSAVKCAAKNQPIRMEFPMKSYESDFLSPGMPETGLSAEELERGAAALAEKENTFPGDC